MKIFIVLSHLGGGGAERVGCLLANGFAARSHDVYIITNLHDAVDYDVDTNVRVLNMVSLTNNKVVKWFGAIRNLRRYVKKNNPDAVIGIMQLSSFISRVACLGTKTKVVMTEHYAFDRSPFASMAIMEKFTKFHVNKIYDKVTVLTQEDKHIIGDRLNNVEVVPNPLSLETVDILPYKGNVVLAVGRLDAWHVKGFDVLIKSFGKLLNGSKVAEPRSKFKSKSIAFKIREEGWKLQIAGTGSEESLNYLKRLCKENGLEDSVEFLGFRKDVEKLYQDASIFVLSSRYEGFGLVLIEAMSRGCACIACDYKGRQREIMSPTPTLPRRKGESSIESQSLGNRNLNPDARLCRFRSYDGERTRNLPVEACETGILCEPDNVEALTDAMAKMIMDDEYRESVRKNAIERSKYYSIENTMNRWESLLNQVVNKK